MTVLLHQHLWQMMLLTLAIMLFSGLPVAVVLAGTGIGFGMIGCALDMVGWNDFGIIYYRIFGTLFETEDIFWSAVPLLLFMGIVLHYSGIADELQTCLQRLFRNSPAGLAIATLLIGTILAPAAGMIGASVVTLALIALPVMLEQGYKPVFASGVVAAAGTLGVAFPPGVMLVFVAAAMGVYAPFIFLAMLGPSLLLLILFGSYCLVVASRNPALVPVAASLTENPTTPMMYLRSLVLPLALITLMILAVTVGYLPIAEAAAVGAMGVLLLSIFTGRFNLLMLKRSIVKTTSITAMIFFIFIGASIFNLMFRLVGGFDAVSGMLTNLQMGNWGILGVVLLTLFVLGFFVDWIELVMVSFPLFRPALDALDFSAMIHSPVLAYSWITVLITMTLQISFLTPPFGYALFFLKGSAPPQIRMKDIYRGVAPFVFISIFAIGCVAVFPPIATWLPGKVLPLNVNRKENVQEAWNGDSRTPAAPLLYQFGHVPAVLMLNPNQDSLPLLLAYSAASHGRDHRVHRSVLQPAGTTCPPGESLPGSILEEIDQAARDCMTNFTVSSIADRSQSMRTKFDNLGQYGRYFLMREK